MTRIALIAGFAAALSAASPSLLQAQDFPPPPAPEAPLDQGAESLPPPLRPDPGVAVTTLAAPDLFSNAGRATGLPGDLWRDASPATARTVLPLLATKPLSPAAAALGRRVLATGAVGPKGVGDDPAMAGARATGLVALGDLEAASAILARTAGVERDPGLSRAAAEAALTAGDDARACAVANALQIGRDDVYWLRLRTFCLTLAGQVNQAQLTFELAQESQRDAVFGRLMGAKIAGFGDPGAPSQRNGLERALSRSLGLAVDPPPAPPQDFVGNAAEITLGGLLGEPAALDGPTLDKLIARAEAADAKAKPRLQAAALLLAALGVPVSPEARGALALYGAEAKAPAGRSLALDIAADQKLMGEAALLALWTSAEAGAAGPLPGDRAAIVRALRAVGLEADARSFAAEGFANLR